MSRVPCWLTFLGVGQDFRSLNFDVRFPVLGFPTNTEEEAVARNASITGQSLSDTWVIDWGIHSLTFFHFWCFDCWKVQRGVVVAQKQVGCSSELKSGRSAVSNIDVLFWEIPAARNLDIFSFLLIDVIRGWWEGRGGSFLHCRHQIVSASASKLGGFLAKLPSWRGNKMALLKILTLGKLKAMSRHGSKIRESCKGQLVTTPPTELWLPNLEVGTLKSELSGLLRKSDRWGRAEGACWEKDPNSGSSWPGQWTHPLAISSDH